MGRIFLYADERRIFMLLALGSLFCLCLARSVFLVYIVFQFLANLFIISYISNIANPPLLITIAGSWRAAFDLGGGVFSFVAFTHVAILGVSLGLKFYLSRLFYGLNIRFPWRGALAAAAFAGLILFHGQFYKRMNLSIFNFPTVGAMSQDGRIVAGTENLIALFMAKQLGMATTWLGEFLSDSYTNIEFPQAIIAPDALEQIEFLPKLALPPTIVMIQVESFDYCLLSIEHNQEPIMPFIRSLLKESMAVPVNMSYKTGSQNSDYEVFSANPAIFPVIYYTFLPDSAFENFLISKINAKGYQSVSMAAQRPSGFSIARAYAAMGFSQSYWNSDLYKAYPQAKVTSIGNDRLLFDFMAAKINPQIKQFLFAVTMSMHFPYIDLAEVNHFGRGSDYEKYLSTAFFVDQSLKNLYNALPAGALFCIWGDHPSNREFVKNLPGGRSVPFIINIKGASLAPAPHGRQLDSLYQVGIYLRQLFS
jgi:hypothetical protein